MQTKTNVHLTSDVKISQGGAVDTIWIGDLTLFFPVKDTSLMKRLRDQLTKQIDEIEGAK